MPRIGIPEAPAPWTCYSRNFSSRPKLLRMELKINYPHVTRPAAPWKDRSYIWEISRARVELSLHCMRAKDGPVTRRRKKVRETLTRRTSKDVPPYTWSMGYNNCVGRCTGGVEYPRLSGSSLNRLLKKPHGKIDTDLSAATKCLIKVATEAAGVLARRMAGEGWPLFYHFIVRRDPEDTAAYSDWVSEQDGREASSLLDGLDYGIHMLSPRSRGKIKDKATAFYRSCPGSRVFVTLTFVAAVDDQSGVTLLNKFLTAARAEFGKIQYLWIAEKQTENPETPDNIHFHMILNKRLPVKRWNALWVLQQYNAGLRARNKYGELIGMAEIEKRVKEGTVGKVLNPFDVKKVYGIGGLSAYLTKYITKQPEGQAFGCAVWHCSRGVSRLFVRATVGPSAFRYCMSLANCKVDKSTGEVFMPMAIKDNPFFMLVYINNKGAPLRWLKELEQCNKWVLSGVMPTALPMTDDDDYRKYFISEN